MRVIVYGYDKETGCGCDVELSEDQRLDLGKVVLEMTGGRRIVLDAEELYRAVSAVWQMVRPLGDKQ